MKRFAHCTVISLLTTVCWLQHGVTTATDASQFTTVTERNISATTGSDVTLVCDIFQGSDSPRNWYLKNSKHDKKICDKGKVVMDLTDKYFLNITIDMKYVLGIHNVTTDDGGIYMCKENGGFGPNMHVTNLRIVNDVVISVTQNIVDNTLVELVTSASFSLSTNTTLSSEVSESSGPMWIIVVVFLCLVVGAVPIISCIRRRRKHRRRRRGQFIT